MKNRPRIKLVGREGRLASLPISILLLCLFFFPMILALMYSFATTTNLSEAQFTIGNYVTVFTSMSKLTRIFNTLYFSALTVIFTFLFSLPIAFFLAKKVRPGIGGIIVALMVAPMFMSDVVRLFGWNQFFIKYGLLNVIVHEYLGFGRISLLYTPPLALFGQIYLYYPYMLFPIYIAISNIDDDIIKAARDLGANGWHILKDMIIGMSKAGIVIGFALTYALSFADYLCSDLLGGGSITMVGDLIHFDFGYGRNWNVGSAEAIITTIILFLISITVLSRVDIEKLISGK